MDELLNLEGQITGFQQLYFGLKSDKVMELLLSLIIAMYSGLIALLQLKTTKQIHFKLI